MKTPTLSRFILVMALLLPATLSTAEAHLMVQLADPPPDSMWRIELADPGGQAYWNTSLALDTAGHPHIAYSEGALKYAYYDGQTWITTTVDNDGRTTNSSSFLVLDDLNRPHLSYYDRVNGHLKYAWFNGATWQIETADYGDSVGNGSSLALDSAGHPHISYTGKAGSLRYAVHDGLGWNIEVVSLAGGYRPSLALDAAGNPHIAHYDWRVTGRYTFTSTVLYTYQNGADWITTALANGSGPSLALDTHGLPQVSYVGEGGSIHYQRYTGAEWQAELVDARGGSPDTGPETFLALDRANQPHLVFSTRNLASDNAGYFSKLVYAFRDPLGWHSEDVDLPPNQSPRFLSLKLGANGNPSLTYCRATFFFGTEVGQLQYAQRLSPLLLSVQAQPDTLLQANDVLTYTLALMGAGVDAVMINPLPPTLSYITGSVTSPAVYSPTLHAILWQGTLPTATAQIIQFQATANISDTTPPTVIYNAAWLTDTLMARSVSAASIVNGYRMYVPLVNR